MAYIGNKDYNYKICSRCIMDTTSDPNLVLDENGVCNYCHEYDREYEAQRHLRENGNQQISELFSKIKSERIKEEYDCALGLSGGVDSSYLLHLCHQYGLRVLAIHVDAGWNSEIAVQNIEKMCSKLGYDLQTVVMDWPTIKELQRAYLFSGLGNQDVPQDHCFMATVRQYCRKYHIKYLISGWNLATEGILSHAYQQSPGDWINIKDVYKKCGRGIISLKKYPHTNLWDKYIGYPYLYPITVIRPLCYIEYSKKSAIELLEKNYDWKYYGGKHFESRFTRFFQEVYLPQKYGWEKRRDHISSLIVGGEMTREEGLREIAVPTASEDEIRLETEYVLKKLDVSEEEWRRILASPNKTIDDYNSENQIKKRIRKIKR